MVKTVDHVIAIRDWRLKLIYIVVAYHSDKQARIFKNRGMTFHYFENKLMGLATSMNLHDLIREH